MYISFLVFFPVCFFGEEIVFVVGVPDADYLLWLLQIFESLKEARIEAGMYHGQMPTKAREDCHRSMSL